MFSFDFIFNLLKDGSIRKHNKKLRNQHHHHHCVDSTDFPVSISQFVPIIHYSPGRSSNLHSVSVLSWSANICTSLCRGPWKNVTYEFTLASVSRMSCSYVDDF